MDEVQLGHILCAVTALIVQCAVAAEDPRLSAAAAGSWCGREETAARLALAAAEAAAADSAAIAARLRLGAVLAAQDRLEAAEGEYRQAVTLAQASLRRVAGDLPARMRDAVLARYAFGDFLRASGSYAQAETEFRWARDQAARFIGGESPEAVRAAAAAASLRYAYSHADELAAMEQRIRRRLTDVCGKADLELAGLEDMRGFALMRDKRFSEALPVYGEIVSVNRAALPSDHPRLATALNRLASVQFELGRKADAIATLEEALAVRERGLGPDHPLTRRARANLASVVSHK